MISISIPVSRRTRATNSAQLSARRQASVATLRAWVTPWRRILPAQTLRASMVRSMAARESEPLAPSPSPRRTIRENASTTRNPSPRGRATSNRQLLVPRSSAASTAPSPPTGLPADRRADSRPTLPFKFQLPGCRPRLPLERRHPFSGSILTGFARRSKGARKVNKPKGIGGNGQAGLRSGPSAAGAWAARHRRLKAGAFGTRLRAVRAPPSGAAPAGGSSSGRTTDSDSVNPGSNPGPPATHKCP